MLANALLGKRDVRAVALLARTAREKRFDFGQRWHRFLRSLPRRTEGSGSRAQSNRLNEVPLKNKARRHPAVQRVTRSDGRRRVDFGGGNQLGDAVPLHPSTIRQLFRK